MSSDDARNAGVPPPATPSLFLVAGARIAQFTVERVIGAGGMGIVYLAEQAEPKRWCAVKVLQNQHARPGVGQRFKSEVAVLGRLNHPTIAMIFDAGVHSAAGLDVPFFAMELVEGAVPITRFVADHKLSTDATIELFAQVCEGIEHVHEQELVHRDIKPSNILVRPDGQPKIIDFGIAALGNDPGGLTMTGSVVGTIRYMAPEQLRGAAPDVRSDVFSLGVLLYELICGESPMGGGPAPADARTVATAFAVAQPMPKTPPSGVARDLYAVLLKALELDANDRYQSVADLRRDLLRFRSRDVPLAVGSTRRRAWIKRIRRSAIYFKLAAVCAIVLLTHAIGQYGGWYFDNDKKFYSAYAGKVLTTLNYVPDRPSESVRIVRLTDGVDYAALAKTLDIKSFNPRNLQSLRLLHAVMHARLRAAGAKVIAWDIFFDGPSIYDAPLAREWKLSADAGVRPIAAKSLGADWNATTVPLPLRSSALLGITSGSKRETGDWHLDLGVQREAQRPVASLALLASASYAGWGDRIAGTLPSLLVLGKTDQPSFEKELPVGYFAPADDDARQNMGIRRNDLVSMIYPEMPPRNNLEAISHNYDQVALASDEQLRYWFAGKLVIIGDCRLNRDGPTKFPNGIDYYGPEVNAQACEQLISQRFAKADTHIRRFGMVISVRELTEIAMTGLGGWLGWRLGRRLWMLSIALPIVPVVIGAGFLLSYQLWGWIASPIQAAIGGTSAFLLIGAFRYASQVHTSSKGAPL